MKQVIYLGATEGYEATKAALEGVANVRHVPAEQPDVAAALRTADGLLDASMKTRITDDMVVNMVDVGEETGALDNMLYKVADVYDEEVAVLVESLISLLEPLMVVILGLIVGFIVIALFLPLVKLLNELS